MKTMINLVAGMLILLALLPACKTMKVVGHDVKDSTVLVLKDSTVVRYVTKKKDSTVISYKTVGIPGTSTSVVLPRGHANDTFIRNGIASLHRWFDNRGNEHIDFKTDSATHVFDGMVYQLREISQERDSLRGRLDSSVKSRVETTVLEKKLSWWGRVWAAVERYLAWIGVAALVFCIYKLVRKFV